MSEAANASGAHRAANRHPGGFSLVELLITVGIIVVLLTVTVLILNPVQLLYQSQDARRTADLGTLNKAISLYYSDALNDPSTLFMGSSSVLYISVPDNSPTCSDLGLPSLPSGWTYHCAPSSSYTKTDGTGWVPINFNSYSGGNIMPALPVDPANQTSTGDYYAYSTNGTQYELTALPASTKQRAALQEVPDISDYPGVEAMGTDLTLSPLYDATDLIGYWKFDDATGTTAVDSSGGGNNVDLMNSPSWGSGKIASAISMNGTNQYGATENPLTIASTSFTLIAWTDGAAEAPILSQGTGSDRLGQADWMMNAGNNKIDVYSYYANQQGHNGWYSVEAPFYESGISFPSNRTPWSQVAVVGTGVSTSFYGNGKSLGSVNVPVFNNTTYYPPTEPLYIGYGDGSPAYFAGLEDEVRVYDRALSPAEILAIYNAER
jgi:type II secretory pathway pseudopilin PulG